ncbi:hypothetical protein Vadar_024763 [Vaccinium darrowii]|uniref:Uncharacterized protein n=1 Tax=Vaccinium darrowii TaxID=229202 RepID=A0ACB7Y1V0_9ERIC|nr:hypothetical protein Vadar_024763 [Vaccinium darrowii]
MYSCTFIATAAGLPFLNPYKNYNADFRHGVNFAVAGATALPAEALAENNITSEITYSSLNVQLDWMSAHFDSICDIGAGKSIEEVKSLVPSTVQAIQNAARRVISYGAVRVVVPGNFPIGCLPCYLNIFQSSDSTAYDDNKCLKDLNELSKFYNEQLQQAITGLNKEFKNAVITYGDYYNAFEWLLENADYLGFDSSTVQIACCGIGGDYNFNPKRLCGTLGVQVCQDPNKFVSWDGIHFTQEAYKHISEWIMDDLLPKLQCSL